MKLESNLQNSDITFETDLSKAVSWDLLTTFWNIAGNAVTGDVLHSMLMIVALGNPDTIFNFV